MIEPNKRVIYRDRWIKLGGSLLGAHYIDSLNRSETFFERLVMPAYYINLIGGFLMAFVLWQIVSRVTVFLDNRYSWFQQTTRRIVLQALLGVLLPLLVCFFLEVAYLHFYWNQTIFEYGWVNNEFRVIALILIFINFLYFTYWLYYQFQQQQVTPLLHANNQLSLEKENSIEPLHIPEKKPGQLIEVTKGSKILLVSPDELAFACLKDGYCYLKMFDAETYVTTYTLDDLYNLLEEASFFRANRQIIINKNACRSYQSIENGKIQVDLEPALKDPVIVSQKRAKAFREWIGGTPLDA